MAVGTVDTVAPIKHLFLNQVNDISKLLSLNFIATVFQPSAEFSLTDWIIAVKFTVVSVFLI